MNVGKEHQKNSKHKYCVILDHGFFPQGLKNKVQTLIIDEMENNDPCYMIDWLETIG